MTASDITQKRSRTKRTAKSKSATELAASANLAAEETFLNFPFAVAVFDESNSLLAANPRFVEAFGFSEENVLPGQKLSGLLNITVEQELFDDDGDAVGELIRQIGDLPHGGTLTETIALADKRHMRLTATKHANGHWQAVLYDITSELESQAMIADAENRWNFALESARQGVWDSKLDTGEMFYSHMWREIRGLAPDEDIEATIGAWEDRLHPDDRERMLDTVRRQDEGEVFEDGFEYREKHRDGHWIWIMGRGRAVSWDAQGKPTRIIGTDTDITAIKETQAQLTETEARWNFALRGSGQGVWDCDIPTKKMYYSPVWRQMRGIGLEEEIDGDPEIWLARVHPDDRERLRETIRKQDTGEIPFNAFEYREKHRDGHYIWIKSRGEPVEWDEDGKPVRIIGIDTDITVKKELELKVAENLKLVSTMLDNFPGGICMFDEHLVLTVANRTYYEVTQIPEEWFPVGTTMEDMLRFHAERGEYGAGDPAEYVAERLADAKTFTAKTYRRTRPADGVTLEFKRTPLEGGGYVLTIDDITAQLASDNERAQLERELSQAQKLESLGTLASGVAHEINTPIQYVGDNLRFISESIRDTLELLMMCRKVMRQPIDPGLMSERATEIAARERELDLKFILEELPLALEHSVQGIRQVSRIVRAIKEFSHPGQTEKVEADLNNLIETTLIVSRNQWKYVAEVETDLDADLPTVICQPGDISQVLLNLLVNAAQAITEAKRERGLISVATRRVGDRVVIEISDNGCGIPEENIERIYDPFFTTKDVGTGTGQGLSLAFSTIVKRHGGSLDCRSVVGEGTTFVITLPTEEAKAASGEAA